jgi:uncharacterized protein (TIGR00106 family)
MPMFEVTIVPLGVAGASVSRFVKVSLEEIKASGLPHQLTPMGTCLIGTYAQVLPLLEKIHARYRAMGVDRVSTSIKVDDRFDKALTFEGKLKAVTG